MYIFDGFFFRCTFWHTEICDQASWKFGIMIVSDQLSALESRRFVVTCIAYCTRLHMAIELHIRK